LLNNRKRGKSIMAFQGILTIALFVAVIWLGIRYLNKKGIIQVNDDLPAPPDQEVLSTLQELQEKRQQLAALEQQEADKVKSDERDGALKAIKTQISILDAQIEERLKSEGGQTETD